MIPAFATFRAPERRPETRLPVTLVTGFLGSGKTTLINHILTNRKGVRAAVLVNELGEIGIDNELIVASGDDMIELSNGCICCSTNNDLVDSIVRVLARSEPVDHILVETTGVADPLPVALTVLRPEFRETLRLDAIVTVADAAQFSLDLFAETAARNQFLRADVVLVNKSDCVDDSRLEAIEEQIRALNPQARLLRTTQSAVPLALILDVALFDEEAHLGSDGGTLHLAGDGFVSLSFASPRAFSVVRFQEFLDDGRPAGLFRGKGFLSVAETGKRYVFHLVGNRFSIEEDTRAETGLNRLVLIGRNLDLADLRARLERCLVEQIR